MDILIKQFEKIKKVYTLKEAKAHPIIDDIFFEVGNMEYGKKDWWIYLKEGYICSGMECGTIHEQNLGDVLRRFNNEAMTVAEYDKRNAEWELQNNN